MGTFRFDFNGRVISLSPRFKFHLKRPYRFSTVGSCFCNTEDPAILHTIPPPCHSLPRPHRQHSLRNVRVVVRKFFFKMVHLFSLRENNVEFVELENSNQQSVAEHRRHAARRVPSRRVTKSAPQQGSAQKQSLGAPSAGSDGGSTARGEDIANKVGG